jgi:hypothetical protein
LDIYLLITKTGFRLNSSLGNSNIFPLGFCTTKQMVSKLKKPPREWKKIIASYISDKGLITRLHRELKKLNPTPQINYPIKKWATELNRTFSK